MPACLGRPRQEARGRHAGDGVGLQDEDLAAAQHHVRAAVAPAEKRTVGLDRQPLGPLGRLGVDARGAYLLRHADRVLGRVVEKLAAPVGDDFDQRQRLERVVADDARRDLVPSM